MKSFAVVIPAGGSGSRFDSRKKKQFTEFAGSSLLYWSLKGFLEPIEPFTLTKIVIAIPEDTSSEERKDMPSHDRIEYVTGGNTRQLSVLNGLKALHTSGFKGTVLVHDAARPLWLQKDVLTLLNKIDQTGEGALLASTVPDTLKHCHDLIVLNTEDRSKRYLAQTPQGAPFEKLYNLSLKAVQENIKVTDDASILEAYSEKVHIIPGDRWNIKLTNPEDRDLFEFLLKKRNLN